jgi:dTDP-4-amino-4,6-dideoxygalactose transaminase
MNVPFVDLKALHAPIRSEIDAAIASVIDRNAYVHQEEHKRFEEKLAESLGAAKAAGVSCGTCALQLSLQALGVGRGDEVITAVNTAIPTSEAITAAGADVVFADIRPGTFALDPDKVRKATTKRTRAIIPVHLYGFPAPMHEIMAIAQEYGLHVVEDVAQAQGATYHGRKLGTIGTVGCFSFFPSKNLGAMGDGGAAVSMNEEVVERVAMLANHGRKEKFTHEFEGGNYRLDNLQAAILLVKLPHLDEWNKRRRAAAAQYDARLAEIKRVKAPVSPPDGESVYHLYVIRTADRDALAGFLKKRGIGTGLHYPLPLHLQPAYSRLGLGEGSFPEAEAAAREVLSLPMFADITTEQINYVCDCIGEYYGA